MTHHSHYHHYRSPYKRGLLALIFILMLLLVGTIGIHVFEDMSYLDSFYLMSMIATAQGPAMIPKTAAGKIFIAFMSFVSVSGGVAALGFLFGPFFGKLWRVGVDHLEEEFHIKKSDHH